MEALVAKIEQELKGIDGVVGAAALCTARLDLGPQRGSGKKMAGKWMHGSQATKHW